MPIPEPPFDTRTWREFMDEALRRIPTTTPEWTNPSDADPGVTLVQLFAFMSESVVYRANRIPDRSRRAFLRLLGLGLRPASAARGLVAFSRRQGPVAAETVAAGARLTAGKTPFRVSRGLDVLPVEAEVFYKRRLSGEAREAAAEAYGALYASFADPPVDLTAEDPYAGLDFYETASLPPPRPGETGTGLDVGAETVDGLWIAVFARRGDSVADARAALRGRTLSLGVMPALDAAALAELPETPTPPGAPGALVIETPNLSAPEGSGAAYRPLGAAADADPLTEPALLEVALGDAPLAFREDLEPLEAGSGGYPPDLTDDPRAERLVTWLRVRARSAAAASGGGAGGQVSFRVAWLGVNASRVEQRSAVAAELLPQGTGEPDQAVTLANAPVLPGSLELRVNGALWTPTDSLLAAPPEAGARGEVASEAPEAAQVYLLDPQSGEIRFGDGLHGARPPRGAAIVARYDHGGGPDGMVGIGAIKAGAGLPSGVGVTNPLPTWGGAAGETLEEAERRAPSVLANRDRLVTEDDFAAIARRAPGVEIGRVEALPLTRPDRPDLPAPGAVTVMVVPRTDPLTPRHPRPDRIFLQAVCAHLAPRRLITTELHVAGPVYRDVWVSLSIDVAPGRDTPTVRDAVAARVATFLSALEGGFGETGWPLGRAVDPAEILVRAAQTDGVSRVGSLLVGDAAGALTAPKTLSGLELPRLAGLSVVASADPLPLDALQGTAPAGDVSDTATPVPVVPDTC